MRSGEVQVGGFGQLENLLVEAVPRRRSATLAALLRTVSLGRLARFTTS